MDLEGLGLKEAYDSDEDDILNDFYIPALSNSISYKRMAGFFSSSSLAVSAKGLSRFIQNGGTMQLICCARFQNEDLKAIERACSSPEKTLEESMLEDLEHLENEFIIDHVRALGWMLAKNKLEIRVAIVYDEDMKPLSEDQLWNWGIFHLKVGIMEDEQGNVLSFSGSDNESAAGWTSNVEEFKVFFSWKEYGQKYLQSDLKKFNKFWNKNAQRTKIIEMPDAIRQKMVDIAPVNFEDLHLKKWHKKKEARQKTFEFFDHQHAAIRKWLDCNKKCIFEMATGTGKTFAALGCLMELFKQEEKVIAIISCPYNHLLNQWVKSMDTLRISTPRIIADGTNPSWRNEIADFIYDIKNGLKNKLIILTTHSTFPKDDFLKLIKMANIKLFLIADEVHGIGAEVRSIGLIDEYTCRLGLSATPNRWFDDEGTKRLIEFFGNERYPFGLKQAINTVNPATGKTYLTPYFYKPYFVEFTDDEYLSYIKLTKRLGKLYHYADDKEKERILLNLRIKRKKIIDIAQNKYVALEKILSEMGKVDHTLIYCAEKCSEQLEKVQKILNERNVIQTQITQKVGKNPTKKFGGISERERILDEFANGTYQAIVAQKILDEGVDVPQAKTAILMASTDNPRQYIQRRGRVLRRAPGKERAIIYDIIVIPTLSGRIDPDIFEIERKLIENELKRYRDFADTANNRLECIIKIEQLEEKYQIIPEVGDDQNGS